MAQIINTPIEFRCPVCGKITKIMGGEGMIGPVPMYRHGRKDAKDYCRCGEKPVKK